MVAFSQKPGALDETGFQNPVTDETLSSQRYKGHKGTSASLVNLAALCYVTAV